METHRLTDTGGYALGQKGDLKSLLLSFQNEESWLKGKGCLEDHLSLCLCAPPACSKEAVLSGNGWKKVVGLWATYDEQP
jgi:hypothetical protein